MAHHLQPLLEFFMLAGFDQNRLVVDVLDNEVVVVFSVDLDDDSLDRSVALNQNTWNRPSMNCRTCLAEHIYLV